MSVVVSLCRHSLQCHYRGAEKTAPHFLCSAPTVQHYRKKTTPSTHTHKRRRSSLMQHSWQALITVHPLRDTKRTYKGPRAVHEGSKSCWMLYLTHCIFCLQIPAQMTHCPAGRTTEPIPGISKGQDFHSSHPGSFSTLPPPRTSRPISPGN